MINQFVYPEWQKSEITKGIVVHYTQHNNILYSVYNLRTKYRLYFVAQMNSVTLELNEEDWLFIQRDLDSFLLSQRL